MWPSLAAIIQFKLIFPLALLNMICVCIHSLVPSALRKCYAKDNMLFTGVSQGVASLVHAREGGSAELGCSLTPTSSEATTPNLFPLHVVEWVRLGYNVPILIKFGVYVPRVHPNYKGKSYSDVFQCKLLSGN